MLVFFIVFLSAILLYLLGRIMYIIIKDKNIYEIIPYIFGVILALSLLTLNIWAAVKGNKRTVEFNFPADAYKFERIITTTDEVLYNGNDTTIITKADTTYRLTGVEKIIGDVPRETTYRYD